MTSLVSYLEGSEIKKFHYFLVLIASLAYAFTAMNVLYIAALLKPIQAEMGFDNFTRTVIAAIGYFGMFIGAISFGYVADRMGRKLTLAIAITLHSIFTALCGIAADVNQLIIYRTIAGIGTGGALPIPGVYVSEYIPAKRRGLATGLVETSWVWGVLLGLGIEYIVLPAYGWRITFYFGILPLVLVPLILYGLPESIRFLERKRRFDEAISIISSKGLYSGDIDVSKLKLPPQRSIKELLSSEYLRRTVLLVILWMALVYTYHGIFLWLPTFMMEVLYAKSGLQVILMTYIIITAFQIPGYYSATLLLDKLGRKSVLAIYLTGGAIGCIIVAVVSGSVELAVLGAILISIFNLGAWAGLYTYTPELFPTDYRASASGLAASSGRIAGIIGVFVTGLLYEMSESLGLSKLALPFTVFTLVHLLAAIAVVILGIETKQRSLEEITAIK